MKIALYALIADKIAVFDMILEKIDLDTKKQLRKRHHDTIGTILLEIEILDYFPQIIQKHQNIRQIFDMRHIHGVPLPPVQP